MKEIKQKGKTEVSLLLEFPHALYEIARVCTYGWRKYGEKWYLQKDGQKVYSDAAGRHLLASLDTFIDKESGLPHYSHFLWNILAQE